MTRADARPVRWTGVAELYGARLAALALGVGLSIVGARLLGPAGQGDFASLKTAVLLGAQLANLGLSSAFTILLARRPRRVRRSRGVLFVWPAVVGACLALAVAVVLGVGVRQPSPVLWILGALWIPVQLGTLYVASAYLALQETRALGAIEAGGRALAIVFGTTALLVFARRIDAFAGSLVLGEIVTVAVALAFLPRFAPERAKEDFPPGPFLRSALRLGLRAYPSLLLPFLLIRSDVLIVRFLRGAGEAGIYSIAGQIIDVALILPATITSVLLPSLVRAARPEEVVRASFRPTGIVLLALAAGAALFGWPGVRLLFGASYAGAYLALLLLLPGFVCLGLEVLLAQYFAAKGFPPFLTFAWLGAFLLDVALNLAFVPRFGYLAAAASSSVSYAAVMVALLVAFRRESSRSLADLVASRDAVSDPTPALVISALPLDEGSRGGLARELGADTRFWDLQRLRRMSRGEVWAILRARARSAIVVGAEDERRELGDYLLLLAALAPAGRREIRREGREPRAFTRAEGLVGSFLRVAGSSGRGVLAALATWLEARLRLARGPAPRRAPARLSRCLFLKPGLTFGKPVGGSVAHVAGVANALIKRGLSLRIVASQPQAMVTPAVAQVALRPDFALAPLLELNQHRYRRGFAARALEEARRASPDLVYQRYALNDMSGASLKARLDAFLVVEFNGSEVWVQRHWGRPLAFERAARAAESAALRAADLVVAVSEEVAEQARAAGVDPSRILFVPNGVDASVFDPARFDVAARAAVRAQHAIPGDALLFAFVGTFGEWHGTDVLAEAILRLVGASDGFCERERAHFLFVGDGPLCESARRRLAAPAVNGRATFTGLVPHTDTPAILAAVDVLVAPHKPNSDGTPFFGSPTKLFEYMAMARTVVASDLDQIGRILRGWRPGAGPSVPEKTEEPVAILVEPGSPASLEQGLRRAAALGAGGRALLGERARAHVLRHFTWDANVEAVLSALAAGAGTP